MYNVKYKHIFPCLHNIILSFTINKCFSDVSIRMRMSHKTVNMVVVFVKSNENTYLKGRGLMQMYRVVPITKRGKCPQVLNMFYD